MKFYHLADVHLGAMPDRGMPWSRRRRDEIWETFRTCIRRAGEEQVDLVLIAGDLFHTQPSDEELREIDYLFDSVSPVHFVLIAGNHDYLYPGSPVLAYNWSPNVTWLFSDSCECVRLSDIGADVYGFSYYSREILENLYDDIVPVNGKNCKILLAHGGDATHIPINARVLDKAGFDYVALGHIHKPGSLTSRVVYSGALTPIDSNDTGPHGFVRGEIKKGRLKLEFVPAAPREYIHCELPTQMTDTTYSLQDKLSSFIQERGIEHIYSVVLTGERNPGAAFDLHRIGEDANVLEVEDQTSPAFEISALKERFHGQLIADYIESFEGCEMGERERLALEYGLEALLGALEERT